MTPAAVKDQKIEVLRGLAILLVVIFHINLWEPGHVPGLYRAVFSVLRLIRMPLFSCISGYVYALRPVTPGNVPKFLGGKARRLLLPMVCVGLLTLSFNRKPPYVVPPMGIYQAWKIAVFPVMQLWFLEALFLIFIATTLLEWTKCLDRKWRWFVVLGLASLLAFLTLPGMPEGVRWPFSLDGFFFLLPYFLFGMGLCRFKKSWQAPWILVTAIALALVGLVLQILIVLGRMTIPHIRGTPFFLCLSLTYIFLLFKIHWKVAWLARLGGFSYSIFLFHIYAIFAVGIILSLSRISLAPAWKFGILLVAGLSLPILVDVLLRPFALTRKLFLGLR